VKTLAVLITTPPYRPLTTTAINFVETALNMGIDVIGIFFYQDGVIHANSNVSIVSDEYQAIKQWQQLHQQYQLPLHLCISAAEKRGLTDDKEQNNINPCFTISGLGELVELSSNANSVVQF